MKRNDQQGVTHLAGIAGAVVIAAIIGAAVYVSNNDSDDYKTPPTTPTNNQSKIENTTELEDKDKAAVKQTAKDHFTLVYQKKTTEAYQSTCQGFKNNTSETDCTADLKNGNFYTVDLSAIEYTSVEVRNSQAKISGPIGPLVPNTDLEVSFLKENNQWCVYGYKTT